MPVRSMTGFAQQSVGDIEITIKSVNHRHFDLHWQVPPTWESQVPVLTAELRRHATRGRVDVRIATVIAPPPRFPWQRRQRLPASMFPASGFSATVTQWDAARAEEGAALATDLEARLIVLERCQADAVAAAADAIAALRERPTSDPAQTALSLERADVTEELVRLAAHLKHARSLLAAGGEIGRKLDFLAQELSREASTLLAKPTGASPAALRLAAIGLDMKAEIEKIREQAQNLE